jgi:hypothetical protein
MAVWAKVVGKQQDRKSVEIFQDFFIVINPPAIDGPVLVPSHEKE